MRLLISKPDSLGDQFIAAGVVQALQRLRPDVRIVWHVRAGMEVFAPLIGAEVFAPNLDAPPDREAARLNSCQAPLIVLPFPLSAFDPWTESTRTRVTWWNIFLHATAWDAAVLGLVNRTWVGDFTIAVAPAPVRVGFLPSPARQPLINDAQALAGVDAPAFTSTLEPSFTRSEAAQLVDLFALVEPALRHANPTPLWRPTLTFSSATPASRRAIIAPGVGGDPRRAWGLPNFLRVAEALRARGLSVTWIEGPGDAPYLEGLPANEITALVRFKATELEALTRFLAQHDLLVCHDTAYAHLAAGIGISTVAIYGAGQHGRFHPAGGRVKIVQSEIACAGCQWHCIWDRLVCVSDIPVANVIRATEELLAGNVSRTAIAIPTPAATSPDGEFVAIKRRLQAEVLSLNSDRFARLQIIQNLLLPPKPTPQPERAPVPQPRISVIIPMGRPERADGTLNALARQNLHPREWEVVAVGVGLAGVRERHPALPLKIVELPSSPGPAHKRAAGVAHASGDWLLFVDDDVQPAPDFFQRLLELFTSPTGNSDVYAKVGAIGARLPGGRGTYFERLTDISNFWSQQSTIRAVPHTAWFLYSAAMIVRAEAYRKSGGFNPELMNGEDVDLTQRIQAAGYILGYEPSLVAYHFHGQDTLFRMWRYFWRNGNAAPYFFAQFGGVCCYSIKTVLKRAWGDLQMNQKFQKEKGVKLGWRTSWILLNYFVVEMSLERHYQMHLWENRRFRTLPARTRSDQLAARAFEARDQGRIAAALGSYLGAMLLNFADPVRR